MQIDQSSFFLPGNVYSRSAVIRVNSAEAAGRVVDPQAIRRLGRVLGFLRPVVLDFPAWRRLRRAQTAVPAAAVAEVMAVIAQRSVGWPVSYSAYRPSDGKRAARPGRPADREENAPASRQVQGTAIFQTTDVQVGQAAAQAGFAVVQALLDGDERPQLRKAVRNAIREFLKATRPGTPAGGVLLLAGMAEERGIPWQVVARSKYMRFGLGRNARILKGTESSQTSSIGVKIAKDKSMANRMLAEAGLPVAKQRTARTEKEAIAAAEELGYPLVVKPIDGNKGRAVTVGVSNEAEMRAAFARALTQSDKAVIETLIPGEETRLFVAGGKLLSAARREPAQVRGDGTRSVAELVREENRRPERDSLFKRGFALMVPIELDEEALSLLSQQGLTLDSVPEKGQRVFLRRVSNVSQGGSSRDVTDEVHPSIRQAAEAAARTLCLDVCGVDFVCTDLTRPWQETGGAMCEVNSAPGLIGQVMAAPEDRRKAILEATFNTLIGQGDGQGLRVVALVGSPEATGRLRRALETVAQRAGRRLGIVGDSAGLASSSQALESAADLFKADDIDAALIILKARDLLEQGLGLSRLAGAVMSPNPGPQTAAVRRVLGKVTPDAVWMANDPAALERAAAALGLPTDSLASTWPARARTLPDPDPGEHNPGTDTYSVLFTGNVDFGEAYPHVPRMEPLREMLSSQGHEHSVTSLVGLLQDADHVIGNLEAPLFDQPDPVLQGRKGYLSGCNAERTVEALREAGFTAVGLANNHILDCGTAGLAETMRRLDDAGIVHFGAGASQEDALSPHVHSFSVGQSRRTLVVFGGFEYRARYYQQYRWYASPMVAGVGVISPQWIGNWIRNHRDELENPTFVAFPHWGTDYKGVIPNQRVTASKLVDQGIDLIIGHGAHVAQPVEIVGGKTVVFNMGNFIWNTPGRFDRLGAPPFGVAAALRYEGGTSLPTLNLYPLMTDNEVTNFQSRAVIGPEIEPSLEVLAQALPTRPQASTDSIGHHLRLAL